MIVEVELRVGHRGRGGTELVEPFEHPRGGSTHRVDVVDVAGVQTFLHLGLHPATQPVQQCLSIGVRGDGL